MKEESGTKSCKKKMNLLTAGLVLALAAGCGSSGRSELDGTSDVADGSDGLDGSDGSDVVQQAVVVEIVNTGADNAYLDGSYNYDCGAPYYKLSDGGGSEILDRPPYLACLCTNCAGSGCLGMVDSGPAFLEIPPSGTARVSWPGLRYAPSDGCDGGCLEGTAAGDGPFTITLRYRRASLACPAGDDPLEADIPAPEGDGRLFACEYAPGVRCFADTTALDQVVTAAFRPSDAAVRVELP